MVLFIPIVHGSGDLVIYLEEVGKVTSYYDEYYIVQVDGEITFRNFQNTSLYNIDIPFQLPGLQIRQLNATEGIDLSPTRLTLMSLGAYENLTFRYRINGITSEWFRTDQSILRSGIESQSDTKVYSSLMGRLQKAEIDNQTTGQSGRLISFDVYNPTGYRFKINGITVTKTAEMNPNQAISTWHFPQDLLTNVVGGDLKTTIVAADQQYLEPYTRWVADFFDQNATEGEIYWLNTDIYIDDVSFDGYSNITLYTLDDLYKILPNATNVTENMTSIDLPFLDTRIFLRKFISDRQMTYGKTVEVTLLINNLDSDTITPDIVDSIPSGFSTLDVDEGGLQVGRNLSWEDFSVNSRSGKRITYNLLYNDNDSIGLDYFMPAKLTWGNREVFSQSIPFIRKYIPEKKVFVQKKVKFLNDEDIEVTIQVQNLGEASLTDIIVKEYLTSDNEFKEVTQRFESKGVWKVDKITQGDVWETKYVTDKTNVLSILPEIYGVPTANVMKTIIMTHSVSARFSIIERRMVEFVGLGALAAVLFYILLPPNFFRSRRKSQIKKIAVMENELAGLRSDTGTPNEEIEESHKKIIEENGKPKKERFKKAPPPTPEEKKTSRDKFEDEIKMNQEILEKMKKSFKGD